MLVFVFLCEKESCVRESTYDDLKHLDNVHFAQYENRKLCDEFIRHQNQKKNLFFVCSCAFYLISLLWNLSGHFFFCLTIYALLCICPQLWYLRSCSIMCMSLKRQFFETSDLENFIHQKLKPWNNRIKQKPTMWLVTTN